MSKYDPKSMVADEFINDEEIRDTLLYAEEHKHDLPLIESILEKARPKKKGNGCTCAGLTHREASVLLACDLPEVNERISLQRANAVVEYLKTCGIAADRLTAEGLSYNYPVADNSTKEGRAENRRVEIFISANEEMIKAAEEGTLK